MKNLYRKGKVHPSSPPPPPTTTISDRLALLPATIMTLTVALSPQDREVLAYLISSSCNNNTSTNFSGHRNNLTQKITTTTTTNGGGEHGSKFDCDCFRCYMSYWVRWDTSPNRQLIHEIIDAYEEGLFDDQKKNMKKNKKQRKRRVFDNSFKENSALITDESLSELESAEVPSCGGGGGGEVVGLEKGSSVTKLVSYIGEKIWGAWSKL